MKIAGKNLLWLILSVALLVGTINSSLTDSAWAAGISGAVTKNDGITPIAGVQVNLYYADSKKFTNALTFSDTNGNYNISADKYGNPLPDGEYIVQAYGAGAGQYGYISEFWDNKSSAATADSLIVTQSQIISGIDFSLTEGGAIAGRVMDCLTDTGIAGLAVYTYTQSGIWVDCTYTGSNGQFYQAGLKPNIKYKVEVVAYGTEYISKDYSGTFGVTSGETNNIGEICLTRGGSISGQIVDIDGVGVPNIRVTAYNPLYKYISDNLTNAEGFYKIQGLVEGKSYLIEANAHGTKYINKFYATSVTASAAGIDIILEEGCNISGIIHNSAGAGIDNITVQAYHAYSREWVDNALTSADGSFTIIGLPNNITNYRIEADTYGSKYIKEFYDNTYDFENSKLVSCGENIGTIVLAEGQNISGRVGDGSVGVWGILVSVYSYVPEWDDRDDGLRYKYYTSAISDKDGNYVIPGLRDDLEYIVEFNTYGTDYVNVYYDGDLNGALYMNDALRLSAPASNINIDLRTGGAIGGVVTAGGAGVESLTMLAYTNTGIDSYGNNIYVYLNSGRTKADGSYTIRGLPPEYDNFIIECNTFGTPYIAEFYDNVHSIDEAAEVAAGRRDINFVLYPGASLSGNVTQADGKPIPGITIQAYKVLGWDAEENLLVKYVNSGISDFDGKYTILGLMPDDDIDYVIKAFTSGTFYVSEFYDDKTDLNEADFVDINSPSINLVLELGATIAGEILLAESPAKMSSAVRAKGHKLADITVCAYSPDSTKIDAQAAKNPNGTYTLARLLGGAYTIKAGATGYAPALYHDVETVLGQETVLHITLYKDDDANGLPDWWEMKYFGHLGNDADADSDADGLTNMQEYENGTDPTDTDTDNDGMNDGWEVSHCLDALVNDAQDDADGDGFTNYFEYLMGCDPNQLPVTIYVDNENGDDDTGDGSQGQPYKTIYPALSSSCVGDTVIALSGIYTVDKDILLKGGVSLKGQGAQKSALELTNDAHIICADYSQISGFTIIPQANSLAAIYDNSTGAQISNNIILGASNTAGIWLDGSSANIINNNFLYLDSAVELTQNSRPVIYNNILAYNKSAIYVDDTISSKELSQVDYNNLYSNNASVYVGDNNIYSNPEFVDEQGLNYHLKFDSPVRDTGNPDEDYNDKDGSVNDMGADGGEYGERDNNKPSVQILASVTAGSSPLEVSFIASAADEWGIYSYNWDFGDDTPALNQTNAVHTYDNCGLYLVDLTVSDNSGLQATCIQSIRVDNPQKISIQADPAVGNAPLTVSFYADTLASGNWSWDFDYSDGLGQDSSQQAPVFTYEEPGRYRATVTLDTTTCKLRTQTPISVLSPDSQVLSWKKIGAAGGSINTEDGISLYIPPQALSQDTIIAIAQQSNYPALPNGARVMGGMLELAPAGITLSRPVILSIPYNMRELFAITCSEDPYNLRVYSYTDKDDWQTVNIISTKNGEISFYLNHFSLYTLALDKQESPAAPTNLRLTPQSSGSIRLNWQDNSDNEEGFKIYRNGTPVAVLNSSDIYSFRDIGLTAETLYEYSVRAYNRFGTSKESNKTNGRTMEAADTSGRGSGTTETTQDEDDGSGTVSNCFIATAAFGTPMAKQVKILCRFRDNYLLTNKLGSEFVAFYYKHSPPIADYIAGRSYLRALIRIALIPLIVFSWIMVKSGLGLKLTLLLVGVFIIRRIV